MAKASAEILAGATVGKIQGLATQATPYVATGSPTLADAIGTAAAALDVARMAGNVVFMHRMTCSPSAQRAHGRRLCRFRLGGRGGADRLGSACCYRPEHRGWLANRAG